MSSFSVVGDDVRDDGILLITGQSDSKKCRTLIVKDPPIGKNIGEALRRVVVAVLVKGSQGSCSEEPEDGGLSTARRAPNDYEAVPQLVRRERL
jgi:hypothetical protein